MIWLDKYLGRSPNFSLDVQDKSGRLRTKIFFCPESFSIILLKNSTKSQIDFCCISGRLKA